LNPVKIDPSDNMGVNIPDHPQQRTTAITYRPDVDGLRAVAVLLVVLDHIHTRVTGGYIGVDVFFVISGYLISSVILSEMASGRFSVTNFYERRIRRIFPALLAMLLGSAAVSYFCFVPSETKDFARSLLAALFSVSNFYFWRQTHVNFIGWHHAGYFDSSLSRTASAALLHTWSLGVEEQFYIIFPLFLMAVRRWFPSQLKIAVSSITVLTFALACVWVHRDPTVAFYFAPLRAWELLIGAVISQHYVPAICGTVARNLAATAGLLLILVPAMYYDATTHFPGLAALPPCLGAVLVIAAGETGKSLVGRLLSLRPIVFIGLISYSLYLWHWPIITFLEASYIPVDYESPKRLKLAVLVASLIVGTLSWHFVEKPFRIKRSPAGRRALFLVIGAAVTLTAAVGLLMVALDGISSRFPAEALEIDRNTNYDFTSAYRLNVCFIDAKVSSFEQFDREACLREDPTKKNYLLVGDSHAAQLYPGLRAVFPELNISQATITTCLPLLTPPPDLRSECDGKIWNYIYGEYLVRHKVDGVLIAGRWREADFPELGRTIVWIRQHGIQVILFGTNPEFDVRLPRLLTLSFFEPKLAVIDRHRRIESLQTDEKLSALARDQWKIRYISAFENLCATNVKREVETPGQVTADCPVYAAAGVPLLFDSNHLTVDGSILFAKTMRERNQLP
jgi:peptidoglycan/LPS O-acetylase OafA/YrhL